MNDVAMHISAFLSFTAAQRAFIARRRKRLVRRLLRCWYYWTHPPMLIRLHVIRAMARRITQGPEPPHPTA